MMPAKRNLVSWQPVLTDHQAFTYQSLSMLAGQPMVAYVAAMEDSTRKAQGWSDMQVSSIERKVIPGNTPLRYCFDRLREHRSDIHFFGSPFQQPRLMVCMLMAMLLGIELYLVSEPYSPQSVGYLNDERSTLTQLKAWLRPWVYRLYVLSLRKRISGVFAISRLAIAQYMAAGMPRKKIFPFGYFVPATSKAHAPSIAEVERRGNLLKLVFVGAFIERKGIDVLLAAVQAVLRSGHKVQLDLFGPGDVLPHMRDMEGVTVNGPIVFGRAGEVIAEYDFLVLPSHYDGWGVVVNEALAVGVPVVTSDAAGAGVLAQELGAGVTFETGNSIELARVIAQLSDDASLRNALKAATVHAANLLKPEVAAQYIWEVVCATPERRANVPSPWYSPNDE